MRRKIAIGTIVYKAKQDTFNRLIMASEAGFDVYIYDNSPDDLNTLEFSHRHPEIKYFTVGKNVGLGYGLSSICSQAKADNIESLLFFDQDTVFSIETLEFIELFYFSRYETMSNYSSMFFNAKNKLGNKARDDGLLDIDLTINSGSLYFLSNLQVIGWHDVSYFVDGVDYKYCLDSKKAGFKIGECSYTPGFDHVSEQDDKVYRLFNKDYHLRAYPWFRIVDTTKSSLRLVGTSIKHKEWKLCNSILRMLFIYLACQSVVRVVNLKRDSSK